MAERQQMYQQDILALRNPHNRSKFERWGQAIVNRYSDYFKIATELYYTEDESRVAEIMDDFFIDNQIPYGSD